METVSKGNVFQAEAQVLNPRFPVITIIIDEHINNFQKQVNEERKQVLIETAVYKLQSAKVDITEVLPDPSGCLKITTGAFYSPITIQAENIIPEWRKVDKSAVAYVIPHLEKGLTPNKLRDNIKSFHGKLDIKILLFCREDLSEWINAGMPKPSVITVQQHVAILNVQ